MKKLPSIARRSSLRIVQKTGISPQTFRTSALIAVLFLVLGGIVFFTERSDDTAADGYLVRGGYGTGNYSETLNATIGGEKKEVEVEVGARRYTDEEAEKYLDEACEKLEQTVLGTISAQHVDHDLKLVTEIEGLPVAISWVTAPPDIMDYEGTIGENVPEEGTQVSAEAEITCQEKVRNMTLAFMVFPRVLTEDEAIQREIDQAVRSGDASSEKMVLPKTIGGQSVTWTSAGGSTGFAIAALGFLAAVCCLFSQKENRRRAADRRRAQMMLDYPHIISKLTLLLNAGMSMRKAFEKMTKDYKRSVRKSGRTRAGFEEISRTCAEMENGVPEVEAYEHLGQRTTLVKYRTLSTILIQNLRRGSRELIFMLEQEAAGAFEERKKEARVLGEEAGTKLLLPMFLMLMVVIAILMVPAFVKFG